MVPDTHPAGDHLTGDAEAQIRFIARPHDADEVAGDGFIAETHFLHLHRPFGLRRGRGLSLAAGENDQHGNSGEKLE